MYIILLKEIFIGDCKFERKHNVFYLYVTYIFFLFYKILLFYNCSLLFLQENNLVKLTIL